MDASTEQDRSLEPKELTGGDYGFMALIVVVLIAVTLLGVISVREASKTALRLPLFPPFRPHKKQSLHPRSCIPNGETGIDPLQGL